MSYPTKINAALAKLAETGLKPGQYAPPLHRLLWRGGIQVPPPLFAGFWTIFSFMAVWFGSVWGFCMWLTLWSRNGTPLIHAIGTSVVVGVLYGIFMARHSRRSAQKYKLPKWSEIEPMP